jgi:hypothetical protein
VLVLDHVFALLFAVGSPVAAGVIMFIDRMANAAFILNDALFQLVATMMALLLLYTSRLRAEAAQPEIGLS